MPFLVSDTSVIIDLDRGDFLEPAFGLSDRFVVRFICRRFRNGG